MRPRTISRCARSVASLYANARGKRAITQQFTHGSFRRPQQHDFDAIGLPYQRPIMSYSHDASGCLRNDDKLTTLP